MLTTFVPCFGLDNVFFVTFCEIKRGLKKVVKSLFEPKYAYKYAYEKRLVVE